MQVATVSRQLKKLEQTPSETIEAVAATRILKEIGVRY